MKLRRVVTGHDSSGKAIFVSDEQLEPGTARSLPGWEFSNVWGGDSLPSFPDDGSEPAYETYFPPLGGFRFTFSLIPPTAEATDGEFDEAEVERLLPGMFGFMEEGGEGWHTSPTVDLEIVLQGELILELDDGEERVLRAGDTIVQNGTRHRWRNEGSEAAILAVFFIGVPHEKAGG